MANEEQNKVIEKMRENALQPDVTAALMEIYNRTALVLPPDPWVRPEASEEPASAAVDEAFN